MSCLIFKYNQELKLLVSYCGRFIIYTETMKQYSIRSNHGGYLQINIPYKNKPKNLSVHRVVALTFLENFNNLPDVNHKDGNKKNNHCSNLEWMTKKQNIIHAHKTGLYDKAILNRTKIDRNKAILDMFTQGYSCPKIAKIYNINRTTVYRIISRNV